MGIGRILLIIFLPPLAVLDKGCGSVLLVFVLTCLGWLPGCIAAYIICNRPNPAIAPQITIINQTGPDQPGPK